MPPDDPHEFDQRLSRLEATVEGLARSVGSLADDVKSVSRSVNDYVKTSGKTNWGVMFAGISIMVTIFALGAGAIVSFTQIGQHSLQRDSIRFEARLERMIAVIEDDRQQIGDLRNEIGLVKASDAENAHELDLLWQEIFKHMAWFGQLHGSGVLE